jgi:hypothetical protein
MSPTVALAHGDEGVLEVVAVEPQPDGSVRYEVVLTFESDGHAVAGAAVTMVAEEPGGGVVGPVGLTPTAIEGHYEAFLTLPGPGEWTVRFTSIEPQAVTELAATTPPATSLAAPVGDTAAPTTPTTAPATDAPSTEAPVTEAPVTEVPSTEAPVTEAPPSEATLIATSDGGGSGGSVAPVAIAVGLAALAAAAGAWVWRRRVRRSPV